MRHVVIPLEFCFGSDYRLVTIGLWISSKVEAPTALFTSGSDRVDHLRNTSFAVKTRDTSRTSRKYTSQSGDAAWHLGQQSPDSAHMRLNSVSFPHAYCLFIIIHARQSHNYLVMVSSNSSPHDCLAFALVIATWWVLGCELSRGRVKFVATGLISKESVYKSHITLEMARLICVHPSPRHILRKRLPSQCTAGTCTGRSRNP